MPQFLPYLNENYSKILDHLAMRDLAGQMVGRGEISRDEYRNMDIGGMKDRTSGMEFREARMEHTAAPRASTMPSRAKPLTRGTVSGRRGGRYDLLDNPTAPGNRHFEFYGDPSLGDMMHPASWDTWGEGRYDEWEEMMRRRQPGGTTPLWAQEKRGLY